MQCMRRQRDDLVVETAVTTVLYIQYTLVRRVRSECDVAG